LPADRNSKYFMETQTSSTNRPTFLTIICIICFVGIGFFIVQNLFILALSTIGQSLFTFAKENLEISLQQASSTNPAATPFLEYIFNTLLRLINILPIFSGLMILCFIMSLGGVFLMWNMKKTGFYLFITAAIILCILPTLLLGLNLVSVAMSIPFFVGGSIFITLFALNFKVLN
jgi:hypothetical protein